MKEFLLGLFFAKTILLTPTPIVVGEDWAQIQLDEPIEAISTGAAIYIDVSNYAEKMNSTEALDRQFPAGTVQVKLHSKTGGDVVLVNRSAYAYEEGKIYLIVSAEGGMPVGVKYADLYIRSDKPLTGVSVIWRNFRM